MTGFNATGFNSGLGCGFDADRAARWSTRIGALAWLRLAAFCAIVLTAGCDREADRALLALSGSTMGTSYSVQVADPPSSIGYGDSLLNTLNLLLRSIILGLRS
jgi:hypothetical protein